MMREVGDDILALAAGLRCLRRPEPLSTVAVWMPVMRCRDQLALIFVHASLDSRRGPQPHAPLSS
jgi:hypothetical protein